MIKRFDVYGPEEENNEKGELCYYSDVQQLQQELALFRETCDLQHKLMVSAEQRAENKFEQERDELAARVERLEEVLFDCYNPHGFDPQKMPLIKEAINESPTTSLAERDKQRDKTLLLRLADEAQRDWAAMKLCSEVEKWLRAKAEELG